uniref:Uncharacterized protein n=1 Tax=Glossina austeni TaxID=7395 RepID=A0A1A9UVY1_GLOAU
MVESKQQQQQQQQQQFSNHHLYTTCNIRSVITDGIYIDFGNHQIRVDVNYNLDPFERIRIWIKSIHNLELRKEGVIFRFAYPTIFSILTVYRIALHPPNSLALAILRYNAACITILQVSNHLTPTKMSTYDTIRAKIFATHEILQMSR